MPIVRSWVTGPGGHPGCDGTCVDFQVFRGLHELIHDARRRVAAMPDLGPSRPPRCPQTARDRREFERALAQARVRVEQQERMLLAGWA